LFTLSIQWEHTFIKLNTGIISFAPLINEPQTVYSMNINLTPVLYGIDWDQEEILTHQPLPLNLYNNDRLALSHLFQLQWPGNHTFPQLAFLQSIGQTSWHHSTSYSYGFVHDVLPISLPFVSIINGWDDDSGLEFQKVAQFRNLIVSLEPCDQSEPREDHLREIPLEIGAWQLYNGHTLFKVQSDSIEKGLTRCCLFLCSVRIQLKDSLQGYL